MEHKYKNMASDFSRARSMIKTKNIMEIGDRMRASIYSSRYN